MFDKTSQMNQQETQQALEVDNDVLAEEIAEQAEPSEGVETENWEGKYRLLQDQFTRLAADFDNFRKRMREEQEQIARYGAQKTVLELLPVLDNLERASASLTENSDPQVLFKSFSVVNKQLMDGLDSLGVKKIQAVGQPFDPQFHEAVNRMASNEFPENTVMYEAQSGYTLHDKVIRPAMVVVSTGVAEEAPTAEPQPVPEATVPRTDEAERGNPFRK